MLLRILLLLAIFGMVSVAAPLVADTINFDELSDGTSLTTQYPGGTFANATVISAGISLNELEFPPRSSANVIFNDGGAMQITFTQPITSFEAYFTYNSRVTIVAFDAGNNQVKSLSSQFTSNLALSGASGSAPNERLALTSQPAIARILISTEAAEGVFVLDDLTYDTAQGCAAITLTPALLPKGMVGTNFNQVLTASGGAAPYTFSLVGGALPSGVALSTGGTLAGIPTQGGNFSFIIKVTASSGCEATQPYTLVIARPVLITELRFSGPGGSGDWFVELYNPADAALSTAGLQIGFIDAAGNNVSALNLPANGMIPARGYYLAVGPNYSLTSIAAPDVSFEAQPPNNAGGAGVFTGAANNAANRLDSVAFTSVGSGAPFAHFLEGTGLPPVGNSAVEHSLIRKITTGVPLDTNNNLNDFVLLSPAGGTINGAPAVPGVPGPQGSTSPVERNAVVPFQLLDPSVSSTSAPNRARTTTPVPNGALGTLALRRTFTNNSGAPIHRLRFRVIDITNSPTGNLADLRVLSSVDAVINGKQVRGLTLEQPPPQPNGGGLNSTLAVGVITLANPLPNGAAVNVEFLLGVMRGGSFRFFVNVEALP